MAVLVIAEHDNASLKPATLNAVTAAKELSDDIHVLVAGHQADAAAKEAAAVAGVTKVLHAESEAQAHPLAENLAPLIVELAGNYSHVIATATTTMKNVMPRAAALLDVAQISDASAIVSEDTFVRPIYAGNALATVQTSDKIKLVTIRGTAFKAAEATGGSAEIESISGGESAGLSRFVGQELSKSERPELTSAVSLSRAVAASAAPRTSR